MGKEAEQIGDRCYSTAKHYQSGIAEFSYQLRSVYKELHADRETGC